MLKLLTHFLLIIFFLCFFLPQTTYAATCQFDFYKSSDLNTPIDPNPDAGNMTIAIHSNDLPPGNYGLRIRTPYNTTIAPVIGVTTNIDYLRYDNIKFTPGTISGTGAVTSFNIPLQYKSWPLGAYEFYFIDSGKTGNPATNSHCSKSFIMKEQAEVSSCKAAVVTKPIEVDTPVEFVAEGITAGNYDIYINGKQKGTQSISPGTKVPLGTFPTGHYDIAINSTCGFLGVACKVGIPSRLQCNVFGFDVAKKGSGGGGPTSSSNTNVRICNKNDPSCSFAGGKIVDGCSNPADPNDPSKPNPHPGIATAIGCIHTNPVEFVQDFMKFAVAIAGGMAFLMMVLGAFQMLRSAGNPDSLQAGRDKLTSGVIGLLFVIFAVLLLQIIGVDILFRGLPGFSRA